MRSREKGVRPVYGARGGCLGIRRYPSVTTIVGALPCARGSDPIWVPISDESAPPRRELIGGSTSHPHTTNSGGAATADPNEKVELTVATFNDFGYTDALLAEYTKEHPNVTIVHNKAATSNDARANYFQKLGKTGLADIEAIEIDWMPEVMKYSDLLAPVPADLEGRWLDWKEKGATDSEGNLIGYGTDIGPEGVCYRSDLFAAAGLPTDRDEVAKLLQGDWANYFKVGADYTAKTGKAFFDSAGGTYQGMINQVEAAYENPDSGKIDISPDVEKIYNEVLDASATQSAHLGQWSDDWMAGLSNGAFATMLCPGWMLGVISGNAKDVTGWDIANVFPGGGGNWGGSYLTVPANAVTVSPFKGQFYFQINDAMQKALTRVEDGTQDKAASWSQWKSEVDAIK